MSHLLWVSALSVSLVPRTPFLPVVFCSKLPGIKSRALCCFSKNQTSSWLWGGREQSPAAVGESGNLTSSSTDF